MRHLARPQRRAQFDLGLYIAHLNQQGEAEVKDMNARVETILAMGVCDMAQTNVVTAGVDMPLDELTSAMSTRHIKKIPVTDEEGTLVGSISRSDIVRDFLQSFILTSK